MLVGADLYPCYSHTLSPLPRRLTSGGASVTIRPLIWLLLNRLAKYELRRMFSPKRELSSAVFARRAVAFQASSRAMAKAMR
jgi:hypothetical protein